MNNKLNFLTATSVVILLSSCASGPHASFSERFSDNLGFTSATNVSAAEERCFALTKPYNFMAGSVSYSLPVGSYKGTRKNSTGNFYYSPTPIKTPSWIYANAEGVYIDNQFNKAYLFSRAASGYDDRPIRTFELPNAIFSQIKKIPCANYRSDIPISKTRTHAK